MVGAALLVGTIGAFAQGNKVSLRCKGMPLPTALNKVEQQSAYFKINYSYDDVSGHKVTTDIRKKEAPDAVKQLLEGLPLQSTVKGKFIQVKKGQPVKKKIVAENVATGKLLDNTGEPLIGATVRVVGTQNAVVTDANGRYELHDVSPSDVLEYSYVGMKPY